MKVLKTSGVLGATVTALALFGCQASSEGIAPVGTPPDPGGTPNAPGPTTPPTGPEPTTPAPTEPTAPQPTFPVGRTPVGTVEECDVDQLSGPQVYGNKVKTLLTGLPMTADELRQLSAAPEGLDALIDGWMATPQFATVMGQFFRTAFQQDQIDVDGLPMMLRRNNVSWGRFARPTQSVESLLIDNLRESFARTAMRIIEDGRPFSEVLTTDTYEMTTAMVVLHAFLEQRYVNDANQVRQAAMPELDEFVLYRNEADAPPAEEALDPSHPNFLHFYVPGFADLCLPDGQDTFTVDEAAFGGNDELFFVFSQLVGRPDRAFNREANRSRSGNPCRSENDRATPMLTREDFEDWHTVRLRPVQGDESPTAFYRLAALRGAREIAVRTQRVGFFTTLGFFATWPTNEDNQSRVTLNQTLITALGESFDGTTVTDFSPPNLDEEHSAPGSACYGCHQTLDPMRDLFRRSYSNAYGLQDDADNVAAMAPAFVFRGVQDFTGSGVRDLARILAQHPDFPRGWVQKMCFFANGAPCPEDTDAFRGVVEAFTASNLNFKTMFRELLGSSLVTNTACVEGSTGHLRSISRRDQLCAQMSARLGVEDICGDNVHPARRSVIQRDVAAAAVSIPDDTFARGEPEPVIIAQTGLFTRATREVVCTVVAERAFTAAFGSLSRPEALHAMVDRVMGLPEGDPRHAAALDIMNEHVVDGMDAGANEQTALQSALIVACMSPGMAGVGF